MNFEGRHVVVTGGTGALGRAVVEDLLAHGATVHVPGYEAGEAARFDLASHERVHLATGVSMRDEAAVESYYADLPGLWASIHVVGGFAMAPLLDTSAAAFRAMFELNAMTCFLSCREAVRVIRGRGAGGGRIVNIAARPALMPSRGMIAYATSKAAVVAITHNLADELRDEQILVNAVAPSVMDTPANRAAMPDADFSRWPKLADVARTCTYLASPDNMLTTGLTMPVYGRA